MTITEHSMYGPLVEPCIPDLGYQIFLDQTQNFLKSM